MRKGVVSRLRIRHSTNADAYAYAQPTDRTLRSVPLAKPVRRKLRKMKAPITMSLPSIPVVARELGIDLTTPTLEQQEQVLVEAMRRDLKPALDLLHRKAHEAQSGNGRADWIEDPNSPIGKQLIRIHAGDSLRELASKYFCHGLRLSFFNCCKGVVGTVPDHPMLVQIHCQNGEIASPDC